MRLREVASLKRIWYANHPNSPFAMTKEYTDGLCGSLQSDVNLR